MRTSRILVLIVAMSLTQIHHSFALEPCAILIAGQSLAKRLYNTEPKKEMLKILNTPEIKERVECSSLQFINGATGGSAAECAIVAKSPDNDVPYNCWINHDPDYQICSANIGYSNETYNKYCSQVGENAYGVALRQALQALNKTNARIIGILWSQGEKDSSFLNKTLTTLPASTCGVCTKGRCIYCSQAYKEHLDDIFHVLRSQPNVGSSVPIFISGIGRRAGTDQGQPKLGTQAVREVQFDLSQDPAQNVYLVAFGYDQPLMDQVHPTAEGDKEIAKRVALSIRNYFLQTAQPAIYLGPEIRNVQWNADQSEILVDVFHSRETFLLDPDTQLSGDECKSPKICGFRVFDSKQTPLPIHVSKEPNVVVIAGQKRTTFRVKFCSDEQCAQYRKPSSPDLWVAFAYNTMNEVDGTRIVRQKCSTKLTATECERDRNRVLPIQPALYLYDGITGSFFSSLR